MARQNRSTKSAANKATEPTNTEEATVTDTATETPVEAPAEAQAETPAEAPVDLAPFKEAVAAALAEGDASTGQLPETSIAKVNEAYRAIDGNKGKGEARKYLEEAMLEAVGKLDAVAARGYSDLKSNLSAAGGSKSERTPADPTAAFVQRVASLRLALSIVESDRPEGVDDSKIESLVTESQALVDQQKAYLADESEDKGDGPELTPVVRAAFKAASGKATGGSRSTGGNSGGVRRDIGKHIASAFADVEDGTFLTIAEIAKHKSAEYEGTDGPSQGAISARLFPTTTVAGVEPVEKGAIDGKNPKGARKVAVEA